MINIKNAIILAAGTSSRFAPLSYETPKGLISVRGEILIERQIRQLRSAGIEDIIVVTGYMKDRFDYLEDKYKVKNIFNSEYGKRNNNSSIWVVKDYLSDSYVCSSDNYFVHNPFQSTASDAYYAAVYSAGITDEWCMTVDEKGYIDSVTIGGTDSWYMLGHTFWSKEFSDSFVRILNKEYMLKETEDKLWEQIFAEHLDDLKMTIKKYPSESIFEFDTLDELRQFDDSYVKDTRSMILKSIANTLNCKEEQMHGFTVDRTGGEIEGFTMTVGDKNYRFNYEKGNLVEI